MRNSLLLAIFGLLLSIQTATAQEKWSIGPRAGVNIATFSGDDASDALKSNTRLVLGLTSTYSINERTGVSIDLLYSGEGTETGSENNDITTSYLRVPVTFNYYFRDWADDFRPKIYLGIAPGLLLGAEINESDVKDRYNSFDLAGVAGLGFNYRLSPAGTWLNFDLRYLHGLSDVTESDATELFNKSWQPSIGVAFGLGK